MSQLAGLASSAFQMGNCSLTHVTAARVLLMHNAHLKGYFTTLLQQILRLLNDWSEMHSVMQELTWSDVWCT